VPDDHHHYDHAMMCRCMPPARWFASTSTATAPRRVASTRRRPGEKDRLCPFRRWATRQVA